MKKFAMTGVLALALAGCSSGPGKGAAEDALAQFFEQGAGIKPQFKDFALSDCEKQDGGPGYACSVSGEAAFNLGGRTQREPLIGTFVFDRVGGEWKVVGTR